MTNNSDNVQLEPLRLPQVLRTNTKNNNNKDIGKKIHCRISKTNSFAFGFFLSLSLSLFPAVSGLSERSFHCFATAFELTPARTTRSATRSTTTITMSESNDNKDTSTTTTGDVTRIFGTSKLARQVPFKDAWTGGDDDTTTTKSRWCCLIYATQNGWKLPILFEEIGIPYDWCLVDFQTNQQKSTEFLQINPNGRIPALIDRQNNVTVAESGAILEYVCDELGDNIQTLLPSKSKDLTLHLQCKQWLYWQVSGQGPMLGQSMYFNRIAKPKGVADDFSIQRFGNEAKRCLQMMDEQLIKSGGPYMMGPHVSIVDVACFAYAASAYWACIDISNMAALQKYLQVLHERASFKTGLTIPFARPAFFGPPWATEEQIQAEIAANSAQFAIPTTSTSTTNAESNKKQKTEQ